MPTAKEINKKLFLVLFAFSLYIFSPSQLLAKTNTPPASSLKEEKFDESTRVCSQSLFGTMSKNDCATKCKTGPSNCKLIGKSPQDASGKSNDCYACAIDQMCSEIGLMDFWGCMACDANPKTECVKAGWAPAPVPGGFPGSPGGFGGKTLSGRQCYQCNPKPDRCNQQWPGTSWLAACQANCAAPKQCVQIGIFQGNACFQCVDKPQECKDLGMITKAQCAACPANTKCAPWGLTKSFEQCFKCVPNPLPPQPPPAKTCKDAGLQDNCLGCYLKGQGCNFVKVNDKLTCAECVEPKTQPDCSPYLNSWDCPDCVKRGGQCIGMTHVRGEPDCYYCYKPTTEISYGCKKFGLPEGCDPNPCLEGEQCVPVPSPDGYKSCGQCIPQETKKENTCQELNLLTDCSSCYEAKQLCDNVQIPEKDVNCYRCRQPYVEQCPEGSMKGPCPGSCSSDQTCVNVGGWDFFEGYSCHMCLNKDDTCQKYEGFNSCTPNPCNEEKELCMPFSPKPGLECAHCVTRKGVCKEYDIRYSDSCKPNPCRSDEVCVEDYADWGLSCAMCIPKEKIDLYCDNQDLLNGGCPAKCSYGRDCEDYDFKGVKCHGCFCPHGSHEGSCSEDSCPEGEQCFDTGGGCYRCEGAGTCKEKNYLSCTADCKECEKNPNKICLTANFTKDDGECCQCVDRGEEYKCQEGTTPGHCPGGCSSDQKCVTVGEGCYVCLSKDDSCPKNGAFDECKPNSCNSDETCTYFNVKPGLECAKCEKNKDYCAKEGGFTSCKPNPCKEGETCLQYPDYFGDPCAYCVPKEKSDSFCKDNGALDGGCPSDCSWSMECEEYDLKGLKCHTCECPHGAYNGTCPGSCEEGEECNQLSSTCYACYSKDDSCKKYDAADSCKSLECPSGQTCVNYAPKPGMNCVRCVKKEKACSQLDKSLYPSCDPNPCPKDQTCIEYPDWYLGISCAQCLPKEDVQQFCENNGAQNGGCPAHCDSGRECEEYDLKGLKCHSCDCPHGTYEGECGNNSCSENEVCKSLPGKCYTCEPKPQCKEGTISGTCPGICNADEECEQVETACYQCKEKTRTAPQCPQGTQTGTCPGYCPGQDCVQVDPNCYQCKEKPRTPPPSQCDQGFQPGSCPGSCSSNQDCVAAGECYQCKEKPRTATDDRCAEGFSPGKCYSITCSETEDCVENTKPGKKVCHKCQPKTATSTGGTSTGTGTTGGGKYRFNCNAEGYTGDPECDGKCSSSEYCSVVFVSSFNGGGTCFRCYKKIEGEGTSTGGGTTTGTGITVKQCPEGSMWGGCMMAGGWSVCPGQECTEPVEGCHECHLPACQNGFQHGYCSSNTCPSTQECVQNGGCYACKDLPKTAAKVCNFGLTPGGCPGECKETENCIEPGWNTGCHYCQMKEKTATGYGTGTGTIGYLPGGPKVSPESCGYYELLDDCSICNMRGKPCFGVSPKPGLNCYDCKEDACYPYLWGSDCEECEYYGGECVPVKSSQVPGGTGLTIGYGGIQPRQCYQCVQYQECGDYGLVCNCYSCRPGQACVPARHLPDGKLCYACLNNATVQITYVVIIIETPGVRYVLKDKPAQQTLGSNGLGSFNPSQIMALAKVDSAGGIQKIAGMLKGSGVSIANIIPVSLENLASTLQQGLNAGGKYGNNCFKDFKQTNLPSNPPPSGQAKDKSQPSDFGEDSKTNVTTGGPIIACGDQNGEKSLAILDANGAPVDVITKKLLGQNPDAVKNAISKAQEISNKIEEFRSGGVEGLMKKAVSFASQKVVAKVREEVKQAANKKSKKEEKPIEPNDPLYKAPAEEKSKKILGIIGSSTGSESVKIGSLMKKATDIFSDSTKPTQEYEKNQAKDQWGLQKIGYLPKSDPNSAWNDVDMSKPNVIVAVIDSGLDLTHPDGPEYIWKNPWEIPGNGIDDDQNGYVDDANGWNFIDNNTDLTDYKGHGTVVAGIIAAKANNGIGIAGINPGAVIMPLKVADDDGKANSLNISRAIFYAVNNGARVINVSLGGHGISELEQAAINWARSAGVFVSVASGNVNENISLHGPASDLGVFAVGSIDMDGKRSTISNWGANNGVMAPGEQIYSLLSKDTKESILPSIRESGYWKQSGTSFSSPMVAATASLLLAKNPSLTREDIEDILTVTATDMYDHGWDSNSGGGLLNASAALKMSSKPDQVMAKINALRINNDDRGELSSVDVFASVHGPVKQFTIEVGKGKSPGHFEQVPGVLTKPADNDWVTRIDKSMLRGSKDWVIRINAVDNSGQNTIAQSDLIFGK